jgi:recombinational DNA repair protein (RecF pathway)
MTVDREMRAGSIICLPAHPLMFADNVLAVCCHCGRKVQHRPYVPREVRKLCAQCGVAAIEQDPESEVLVTKRQRRDLAALLKRQRQ